MYEKDHSVQERFIRLRKEYDKFGMRRYVLYDAVFAFIQSICCNYMFYTHTCMFSVAPCLALPSDQRFFYRRNDGLLDWFSIQFSINWLIDWLIDLASRFLINRLIGWLVGWLFDSEHYALNPRLIHWSSTSALDRLIHWTIANAFSGTLTACS